MCCWCREDTPRHASEIGGWSTTEKCERTWDGDGGHRESIQVGCVGMESLYPELRRHDCLEGKCENDVVERANDC
jgi:hypothetical protein